MGPTYGTPNDPSTVPQSIEVYAQIKGVSVEEAKRAVRDNFRRLFGL
jgi:Tat protein secretion system quality control protein TatD with DNase activity